MPEASAEELAEGKRNFVGYLQTVERIQERLTAEPANEDHATQSVRCRVYQSELLPDECYQDELGPKCRICQRALQKRVIPPKVCTKPHTWWRLEDVCQYLNISTQKAVGMLQTRALRARVIRTEEARPHCYVFLLSENKGALPRAPKRRG